MLKIGSRWYDTSMNTFDVQDIWYVPEHQLWVRYKNRAGKEFTCRAEAFVNRFSYTAAK